MCISKPEANKFEHKVKIYKLVTGYDNFFCNINL